MSSLDLIINFILDLINSSLNGSLDFYGSILLNSPFTLIKIYVLMFLGNIILAGIFYIFPWLKKIIYLLCFPFRLLHIYFHIFEIKKLQKDHFFNTGQSMGSPLSTGFYSGFGNTERSSINASFREGKVRDVFKVASAPGKGVLVLLIVLTVLTPFLLSLGRIGLFIHLYFTVACAGVLSPDYDDYNLVYNMIMLKSDLSPFYLLFTLFVTGYWFYTGLSLVDDIFLALFIGLLAGMIYLFFIVYLALKKPTTQEFNIFDPETATDTSNLLIQDSVTADILTSSDIE